MVSVVGFAAVAKIAKNAAFMFFPKSYACIARLIPVVVNKLCAFAKAACQILATDMNWRLSLIVVLLSAAPSRGRIAEAADPLAGLAIPKPSIVMFWAAWCAPCRAEISAWPELQRAAGSLPIHIVTLDTPIERSHALLKALPVERVHHGQSSSLSMLAAWSDRASGLPFAVALDAQGRICASQNGGLTVVRVAAMRRSCAIAPPTVPPRRLDRSQSNDHNEGGN